MSTSDVIQYESRFSAKYMYRKPADSCQQTAPSQSFDIMVHKNGCRHWVHLYQDSIQASAAVKPHVAWRTYVRTFVFLVALGLARVEAVEETAGRSLLQREAALRSLVAQLWNTQTPRHDVTKLTRTHPEHVPCLLGNICRNSKHEHGIIVSVTCMLIKWVCFH